MPHFDTVFAGIVPTAPDAYVAWDFFESQETSLAGYAADGGCYSRSMGSMGCLFGFGFGLGWFCCVGFLGSFSGSGVLCARHVGLWELSCDVFDEMLWFELLVPDMVKFYSKNDEMFTAF